MLGEIRFILPSRAGQKARDVRQQISVKRGTVAAPDGTPVEVSVVLAQEGKAPAGVKPIGWRLLTVAGGLYRIDRLVSLPLGNRDLFNVLKNRCKVEKLQLATIERLELALALFLIVTPGVCKGYAIGLHPPGHELQDGVRPR